MRKLIGLIIVAAALSSCGPSPTSQERTDGRKQADTEAMYLLQMRWEDVGAYEFVPKGSPGTLCVYIRETSDNNSLACFKREAP